MANHSGNFYFNKITAKHISQVPFLLKFLEAKMSNTAKFNTAAKPIKRFQQNSYIFIDANNGNDVLKYYKKKTI